MIKLKLEQLPLKLSVVALGFLAATFALASTLQRSFSTFTPSKEALLSALPVLLCFFLAASLMILFALVAEGKVLAFGVLVATLLFVLPLTSLPLSWRLVVAVFSFLGLLFLCFQARKTQEAYTGFSASHYGGVIRSFFLLFLFLLGIILFLSTSVALERQKFEIPEEMLKPIVDQFVGIIGGMIKQQVGKPVPESELAPFVEDGLIDLLGQAGFKLELKGKPKSLAQVTTRITKALRPELAKIIAPFKTYVPFLIAGMVVFSLLSLFPFVGLIGAPIFSIVYRLLILVRVLKFEEVERTVRRLTLNYPLSPQ